MQSISLFFSEVDVRAASAVWAGGDHIVNNRWGGTERDCREPRTIKVISCEALCGQKHVSRDLNVLDVENYNFQGYRGHSL